MILRREAELRIPAEGALFREEGRGLDDEIKVSQTLTSNNPKTPGPQFAHPLLHGVGATVA